MRNQFFSFFSTVYCLVQASALCIAGPVKGADVSHDFYFPEAASAGTDGFSDFENECFSYPLKCMNEPVLYAKKVNSGISVFRFTIVRSFKSPQCIRWTKKGARYQRSAKRVSWELSPGASIEQSATIMSEKDSQTLDDLVLRTNLFEWPTSENPAPMGADGETWILESVSNGRYHLAHRWSPDYQTEQRGLENFLQFCRFLDSKNPLLQTERHPVLGVKRTNVGIPYRAY